MGSLQGDKANPGPANAHGKWYLLRSGRVSSFGPCTRYFWSRETVKGFVPSCIIDKLPLLVLNSTTEHRMETR